MRTVNKLCVYFSLFISASPHAEVVTDGSVGSATSLSGQMIIPQNLGTTVGNNLFHSFSTFNIKNSESATFTGSAALQNVISRVTGGRVSSIDGVLRSTIGHANFYFINPAGITFGANAQVDVPAAFHLSTAQKLNFGSDFFDTSIHASAPPPSTLTIAEPTSFGFLNTSANKNGLIELNAARLNPNYANHKTGQTVDLVAGNISLKNDATLSAEAGEIRLVALQGEDSVSLLKNADGSLPLPTATPSATNAGNISVKSIDNQLANLNAAGNGAGRIAVWGGKTTFTNANLVADNLGNKNATSAKGLQIHAYSLNADASSFSVDTRGTGSSKNANLALETVETLKLSNNSTVKTNTDANGSAASLSLKANTLDMDDSHVGSQASFQDKDAVAGVDFKGAGGDVTLNTKTVTMNNADIFTATATQGNAGSVVVNADEININKGGVISSATFGKAAAGSVSVDVQSLSINNGELSTLAANGSTGKVGEIKVTADSLRLSNDGEIRIQNDSQTLNAVKAVRLNVNVADLAMNGGVIRTATSGTVAAANLAVTTQSPLLMNSQAAIESATLGKGNAGSVSVTAPVISMSNATIKATSEVGSTGDAGSVTLNATESFNATKGAMISSATYGSGNSGNVKITAPILSLDNTTIKAAAELGSTGDAGDISVNASQSFNAIKQSSMNSATYGSGKAGNVVFNTPSLSLSNSEILALAGTGSGGQTGQIILKNPHDVSLTNNAKISVQNDGIAADPSKITPSNLILNNIPNLTINGAIITAATSGNVNAGKVVVNTQNPIFLKAGSSINSSTAGSGNAANVTVSAPSISVENATIKATAELGSTGEAGSVNINATDSFSATKHAIVSSATYGTGNSGSVNITAPTISIDNATIKASAELGSTGDAGSVMLNAATSFNATNQASMNSATYSSGKAGNVIFNTPSLSLSNSEILALAGKGSKGQTGQIILRNPNDVSLSNNAKISVQNDGMADDPSKITPSNLILNNIPNLTINGAIITAATSGNVNAGKVFVKTQNPIFLTSGSSINSSTAGSGNAGNVTVVAPIISVETATIKATAEAGSTGEASSVNINATDSFSATKHAVISSATYGTGNSGNVSVTAPTVLIDNATIEASAELGSTGEAGSVMINAPKSFTATNLASINTATYGSGKAGNVSVIAPIISVDNSTINSSTSGEGDAGNVTINAAQSFTATKKTIINSATYGGGKAGNVIFDTPNLTLDNAEVLALAGNHSKGDVGQIILKNPQNVSLSNNAKINVQNDGIADDPTKITPSNLILNNIPNLTINGAIITAATSGNVNAGEVVVKTQNPIFLKAGSSINSSTAGSGKAGNVSVTAPTISVENTTIKATAELGSTGEAGSVNINATDSFNATKRAAISSATYGTGNSGNVSITAPTVSIDNAIIKASAELGSTGKAGSVMINAPKSFAATNLASINTATYGSGKAGNVSVIAPTISVDNSTINSSTSGEGDAGNVTINAAQSFTATKKTTINSATYGSGKAGNVIFDTPNLILNNAEILALAGQGSKGQTGQIILNNPQNVNLSNNAKISVRNDGIADDPTKVTPSNLILDNIPNLTINGAIISTASSGNVDAGDVVVKTQNPIFLKSGSSINSSTSGTGNAGDVSLTAPIISVDKATINSSTSGAGNAGHVTINAAQSFEATNEATINSATYGSGKAGNVIFDTPNLTLDNAEVLALASNNSKGDVGQISLKNPQNVTLSNNAKISVRNDGTANDPKTIKPSNLVFDIPNLTMNGALIITATSGNVDAGDVIINTQKPVILNSGSTINSSTSGRGDAGQISVTAPTIVMDNATIKATALLRSKGDAGSVTVNATESLTATHNASINSATYSSGNASDVVVNTANLILDTEANISATANQGSTGQAGSVTVNASKSLIANNRASINSSTFGSGKAGDVTVKTPKLLLDSGAEISALAGIGSAGETGVINLTAETVHLNNGGKITVQNDGTSLNPNAIKPGDLSLDVPFLSLKGGLITAATSGNVNASNVRVTAHTALLLSAGASINSNTSGSGNAGSVTVSAPVVTIDNATISAQATEQSQGQTGNVVVSAQKGIYLANNGKISMQNNATVTDPARITPTSITVSAPDIELKNSEITTESTGNVTAGNIEVNFAHQLVMDPSFIQTTAFDGNGGTITINGGDLIKLENSGFLTSVTGIGDGGKITVTANTLLMSNGVIQANAITGNGGDISINLKSLIPSYNLLIKGGIPVLWQSFLAQLNVIQAASSIGVSGNINLTSPQLNISGSIVGLNSTALVLPVIDRTTCQSSSISNSSLVRGSKGGIPLNEVKAGFIPPADVLPDAETSDTKKAVTLESEPSATKKQQDNFSCSPVSFD